MAEQTDAMEVPTRSMSPMPVLLYLQDDDAWVKEQVLPLFGDNNLYLHALQDSTALPALPAGSLVYTWLSDAALKPVVMRASENTWTLALLPHPDMTQARLGLGVAGRLDQAVEDVLADPAVQAVDVLYCNGRPVFNSVLVGDTYSLRPARIADEKLWLRVRRFLRLVPNLQMLTLHPFKLLTLKEKSVETAALGIVIVEHGRSSPIARRVIEDSHINDGMLHALVLAPRSVVEFLRFLFSSTFIPAQSANKLPPFVGHIKTGELTLSGHGRFQFSLDEELGEADRLELRVAPRALNILPGRHLNTKGGPASKESYKIQGLPVGEARKELLGHPMPWIHHAATEEFKELFLTLREHAQASESFLTLMVLSTLLATVGLFAGSSPVIIGAMILAPLMAPIISLSMGVLRQDERLMQDSARTLTIGVGLALLFATLMTWLTPLETINSEIAARLKPTLLDLAVAVISGIAGAYAYTRAGVAKSFAGVAIAVALVPPLAVTGIGIGWWDWTVFSGALLLFLTNLAGIVLAAAITFLVLGYSPFHRARRGLVLSIALVSAVSVPLALGFKQMVFEHSVQSQLNGWQTGPVTLDDIQVRPGEPVYLKVRLISQRPLSEADIDQVKSRIEKRLDRQVVMEAVIALRR